MNNRLLSKLTALDRAVLYGCSKPSCARMRTPAFRRRPLNPVFARYGFERGLTIVRSGLFKNVFNPDPVIRTLSVVL